MPEQKLMPTMRDMPVARLIPNVLTLMALCSGVTAMRFAVQGDWSGAAMAIFIASIFDILDGRVARLLGLTSKFGAELDSLADLVNFGVAPGFVVYMWALQDIGGLGWIAVLAYTICTALRLARFNVMLEDDTAPAWSKTYFTGIPSPGGAGLALLPLFLVLEFGQSVQIPHQLMAIWLIISGVLMISRLPTLSATKGRRVPSAWVAPVMAAVGLLVAALITNPWLTLSAISTVYLLSLPYGWYSYNRRKRMDAGK